MINDEIRPSLNDESIEQLLDRINNRGYTINCTVNFKNGFAKKIDTKDLNVLNDFRILHHLERYWFASKYIKNLNKKNLRIIDIGIGEALGINEIINQLPSSIINEVVGLEVDDVISNYVKNKYPSINVIKKGIGEYKSKEEFEIILCFELLGHQSLISDDYLLNRLDALCSVGSHIFISSKVFNDMDTGGARKKTYDARIYTPKKFYNLMEKKLTNYKLNYFSQIYPIKRMRSLESDVWKNPKLDIEADFAICVAKKIENNRN